MWQISAGLGLALALTGGAFKLYHDRAQAEQEALTVKLRQSAANQEVLEDSIKSLNQQVLQAEEAREKAFKSINALQEANEQAREEVSELRDKFQKHDMNMLSLRKPKLIENIINRGTTGVLNEFETLTNPSRD